jgi:DNA invertase Pin-like site-specific DNA recombinase
MGTYYAYIRVSTQKQGEHGSSLQEQRAAIDAFARGHGLTISEWFEEQETAAKQGRTQFRKMLAALTRGNAQGVIIHKIDRSARNLGDWADLGALIDRGIVVHFANENLDLHSRGGRLSADIQAVVAADFIRNLREEVKKGLYGRLKQGFYPLKAPAGYIDNGSAQPKTICPRMGPLVRMAFELYTTGEYSLDTLNAELHRRGLRNKRGGAFSRNGLSVILNHPFYYGLMRIKRTGQTFIGNHEPLISKELFDRVQALLRQRAKVTTGIKRRYLLQRMIRCSNCGRGLYAEVQKGHIYYRCHSPSCVKTSLREDTVIAAVAKDIGRMYLSDDVRHSFAEMFRVHIGDLLNEQEEMEKPLVLALAQIETRKERLTDAYLERAIDREAFEARKTVLLNEGIDAQQQLDKLRDGESLYAEREQKFLETLKRLPLLAQLENPAEKREILKSAISNLSVSKKYVQVAWDLPLQLMLSEPVVTYGGQQRATSRTFVPDGHELTSINDEVASQVHLHAQQEQTSDETTGFELNQERMQAIVRLVLAGERDTASEPSESDQRGQPELTNRLIDLERAYRRWISGGRR